jgi:hypothetical protein
VKRLPKARAAAPAEHPPDQAGASRLGIRAGAGLCLQSNDEFGSNPMLAG